MKSSLVLQEMGISPEVEIFTERANDCVEGVGSAICRHVGELEVRTESSVTRVKSRGGGSNCLYASYLVSFQLDLVPCMTSIGIIVSISVLCILCLSAGPLCAGRRESLPGGAP